jgi:hypothetical protein
MFLLDSLLIGGLRFVLDKVATVADQQMNDETTLRERLLDAQMRLDLGELTDKEFAAVEEDVLARIREIRARQQEAADDPDLKVTGVEISVDEDS